LFADLTKWWPSTTKYSDGNNPAYVSLYHDQKIVFRPASVANPVLVVVYARYVTTNSAYQPIYCWNPAGPSITVDGTETANSPLRWLGSGQGNWTYSGASRAICINQASPFGTPNYDGKNILTVIRPTSRTIIKSGGPDEFGNHFYDATPSYPGAWPVISNTWSCEAMDYYGQRYSMTMAAGNLDEVIHHGEYFIQIQPIPAAATTGDFLVVNEVGDSGITPAVCDAITGTGGFVGVAILSPHNRIAVFNSTGDVTSGTFTVPTAGTYKAQICNLSGATRTVSVSSGSVTDVATGGSSPFTVDASKSLYLNLTGLSAGAVVTVS
jgi:hypothetical protein